MKQTTFRQIYFAKTRTGYQQQGESKIVKMFEQDAEQKNLRWKENGYRFIPQDRYEKFLQNSRLLN